MYGSKVGKKSKTAARAAAEKIATLAGAGVGTAEIAQKVGRSPRRVQEIIAVIPFDPQLKARLDAARDRIQEKALVMLEENISELSAGLKDGETRLSDKAQAVRALNEIGTPRFGAVSGAPSAPALTFNLNDPATAASFVQALRLLNEPVQRVIEVTSVDVTPESEVEHAG